MSGDEDHFTQITLLSLRFLLGSVALRANEAQSLARRTRDPTVAGSIELML